MSDKIPADPQSFALHTSSVPSHRHTHFLPPASPGVWLLSVFQSPATVSGCSRLTDSSRFARVSVVTTQRPPPGEPGPVSTRRILQPEMDGREPSVPPAPELRAAHPRSTKKTKKHTYCWQPWHCRGSAKKKKDGKKHSAKRCLFSWKTGEQSGKKKQNWGFWAEYRLECFDTMSSLIPRFPNGFDDNTFIFVFETNLFRFLSKPI